MDVKRKRGRPAKESTKLKRSVIIEKARAITLESGRIPSIRKLAAELAVDPMALYHYFPNKKALLEAITESLIDGLYSPGPYKAWKENLMDLSVSYLTLLLTYPDLLSLFLAKSSESAAALFARRFHLSIRELNLTPETEQNILHLLADYLHGFAYASACAVAHSDSDRPVTAPLSPEAAEGPLTFLFDRILPA